MSEIDGGSNDTIDSFSKYKTKKILRIPSLKPSDWYLVEQEIDFFSFQSRDKHIRAILVLGARLIYSGFHDPRVREMILHLAEEVKKDNLDLGKHVVYKEFKNIVKDM